MAKDKISDYSSTANSNTDIAGINIDEGCAPSGINDAIRTLMAQLKTWQSGGQDVYIHPAGSASAPSITANGDTNTGIFFPAADTVGITTGGTERARVDSAGNLGLGVTPFANSLSKGLDWVNGAGVFGNSNNAYWSANAYYDSAWKYKATAAAAFLGMESGSFRFNIAASGTAGNAITFTEAMRLDASGNFMVGTTTPLQTASNRGNITVNGSASSIFNMGVNGSVVAYLFASSTSATYEVAGTNTISASGANVIALNTNGSERARIDSSGNLLVGTTSANSRKVYVSGGVTANWLTTLEHTGANPYGLQIYYPNVTGGGGSFFFQGLDSGGSRVQIGGSGNIQNVNNSYGAISDIKLKENIVDASPKLADLMQVQVRNYNLIGDTTKQIGVVAQELESVFPAMIEETPDFETVTTTDEDGNEKVEQVATGTTTKSVKYSVFVPMLIKAIQEQQAIITALTARIEVLEQA
jgi:hypothetical protein